MGECKEEEREGDKREEEFKEEEEGIGSVQMKDLKKEGRKIWVKGKEEGEKREKRERGGEREIQYIKTKNMFYKTQRVLARRRYKHFLFLFLYSAHINSLVATNQSDRIRI